MAKDYYALLGVSRKSDDKDIKAAYRKLARQYHPDVNPGDKSAEAKFKEISEAHSVLSDPEKRKMYDQFGSNWEQAQHFNGAAGQPGAQDFNFGTQHGSGGFETIFEQIFGGRPGGTYSAHFEEMENQQPRDVEKVIELSLEEIDAGTKRTLTYQTMDAVKNRGQVSTVPNTKKVEVKIPAGIQDGKKLRVPGKGAAGVNGRSGDLYVTIKWASHEKFRLAGDYLETEVDIPFTTAALGGEVKVPTLTGNVSMKIPEGSQSGQMFRLGGKGITRLNRGRGDLMARLKITVPKNLSGRQKELLKELAELEVKNAV